jgi:hypothetical protein
MTKSLSTNEYTRLNQVLSELKEIVARESKRHMMDQHLTASTLSALETEVIPALEAEIDYDPTPNNLWDNTGGEPPMSMDEWHKQSYAQKRAAWS